MLYLSRHLFLLAILPQAAIWGETIDVTKPGHHDHASRKDSGELLAELANSSELQAFERIAELCNAEVGRAAKYDDSRDVRLCGVNALFGLISLSGRQVTYQEVRDQLEIGDLGCSIEQLLDAGANLDMDLQAVKCKSRHLRDLRTPAILHLSGERTGHYLIFLGYHPKYDLPVMLDLTRNRIFTWHPGQLVREWSLLAIIPMSKAARLQKLAAAATAMAITATAFVYFIQRMSSRAT